MDSTEPSHRFPKGDHNRRISLGLDPEQMAAEAGVTPEALREYETTSPDDDFDAEVAKRVGFALERLEQALPNSQTGRNTTAERLSAAPLTGDIAMDHAQHIRLTPSEFTPDVLDGASIYDAEDHKIGQVSHVHGIGAESQIIVDVGGFLGLGAKPVAVPARDLDFMRDEGGSVHAVTSWTKEQLEQMPEHHHSH